MGALDPVEEPAVSRAAAQVDVLAVVDGEVAATEGEGEAAEPGAPFQEGHVEPRVGEPQRRGDAGEAAADDHGTGGPRAPAGHARSLRRVAAVIGSRRVVAERDARGRAGVARPARRIGAVIRPSPGSPA